MKHMWMRGCIYVRDLFFPPRCVGCGELLPPFDLKEPVFCPQCRTAWEAARLPTIEPGAAEPLLAASWKNMDRIALVAYHAGHTEGVPERMIYCLKHQNDARVFRWVARQLSAPVGAWLDAQDLEAKDVLFTYPPRRSKAVRKDGFDQAANLSHQLARQVGGVCLPLLVRSKHGVTEVGREQKRLNAAERRSNAAASYLLNTAYAARIPGHCVVLVDDLLTTGATLRACKNWLFGAGATYVLYVTVAQTHIAQKKT